MSLILNIRISRTNTARMRSVHSRRTTLFLNGFVLLIFFWLRFYGFASLPNGSWRMSGDIMDVLLTGNGQSITNKLSLTGHYDNGHFLMDLMPIETLDNIAESAGWDGEALRLIQRFPDLPGNNQPRDRSLGFVEPSVFSRYATHSLTSMLLAFADDEALKRLEDGQELVILGIQRKYPEENNVYTVKTLPSGIEISAQCPGQEVTTTGETPIKGFENGFTRWTFHSSFTGFAGMDSGTLLVEYSRYVPSRGKLFKERQVTGTIHFNLDQSTTYECRPTISESALTVLDYSYRPLLFPLSKGIVDQNYKYIITNHVWYFDTNVIAAAFQERKARLSLGIPKQLEDVTHETPYRPHQKIRPLIILLSLFIISVPFAWSFFNPRQASRNEKENNKHER
jgi:hypothetical protein